MIKIEKYSLLIAKMLISNHFEFMSDIRYRIEQDIEQIQPMLESWHNFIKAFAHEDAVYKRHKFLETDELIALDVKRKNLVMELFDMVRIKLRSRNDIDLAAAKLVNVEIVRTYKNVNRTNYEARTADITNMIQRLQDSRYQAAVTKLVLLPTMNELVSANANFNTKYNERADEYRAQKEIGSATDARPATNEAFKEMIEDLKSIYRANERGAKDQNLRVQLEKIAFTVNSTIDQSKRNEAHRKNGGNTDETGGGGIGRSR
ncbi:MAG: DUF6261 family protein [Tannerellaceae bacterium]|jgi:hypothetical protein|nr:DUF6261 family protein [Tannerellaceae bacterium]